MVNGHEERGFCKNHRVKIQKHPEATSTDILDHIKPVLRRKPNRLIIHAGTNDLTNNVNLLKNVKLVVKKTKDESPLPKILFSGVVRRYDIERGNQLVAEVNGRLKNYYALKTTLTSLNMKTLATLEKESSIPIKKV